MTENLMNRFLLKYPWGVKVQDEIMTAFRWMSETLDRGNSIFLCGNGGSFADCLHIAGELRKSFESIRELPEDHVKKFSDSSFKESLLKLEPGFSVRVLGNNPVLQSAFMNDVKEKDLYFAQDLYSLARPGDLLLGISTSGNSANILVATELAAILGLKSIALTNQDGGKLGEMADLTIRVPIKGQAAEVQEYHLPVYHLICRMVEKRFYSHER